MIDEFCENGFVRVPEVLSEEQLDTIRDVVARADDRPETRSPYALAQSDPYRHANNPNYHKVLQSHRDLRFFFPEHDSLVRQERVGGIARDLMQVEHSRIWSESVLIKPPQSEGSAATPWHQDFPIVPFDRRDAVNLWIALDDVTGDQGALEFVPGSHRLGPLGRDRWTADRDVLEMLRPDDMEFVKPAVQVPLNAGDCVAFGPLTLHRAGPNQTERPRRGMSWYWMGSEVTYTGMPHYKADGLGLVVGEPFNHERFPVVA
jgi:ectoine hydroxylase-related dioxygenase (phytanoyl-CoA dioxygenase family)